MKKVLFIINGLLQKRSGKDILHIIAGTIDTSRFEYDTYFTEFPGHATEIAISARDSYDIIIAAGGDGTVNEVGKVLAGSTIVFGIIPLGSGNGLARTLGIPLHISRAIQMINEGETVPLDMGLINGIPFFNMAGIGFDASVAHHYNKKNSRGFLTYFRSVIGLFFQYKSCLFEVKHNNEVQKVRAFLISFANSSQWGYNARICPGANPSDGLLGVTILRSFPKILIPVLAYQLFRGKIHRSKYVRVLKTKQIEIISHGETEGHIDGSPVLFHDHIQVELLHHAINIIKRHDH